MIDSLRLILFIVGALVVAAILFDGLRRKKKKLLKLSPLEPGTLREAHQKFFNEEILGVSETRKTEAPVEVFREEALEALKDQEEGDDFIDSNLMLSLESPYALVEKEMAEDRVNDPESQPELAQKFISIRIVPPTDETFGGYELLRAILSCDLHYGEKKLFHRYINSLTKQKKLFTLASLKDPGDFDLGQMKDYRCPGLILYLNAAEHSDPIDAFEEMLQTAQQLARAIHGALMASPTQPWTIETTEKIRSELIE